MLSSERSNGVSMSRITRPFNLVVYRRVITFAKVETHAGMRDRVTEPGQQFPAVSENVAVMHGHHRRLFAREDISEAGPHVAPFSRPAEVEVRLFELLIETLHARPGVPDQDRALRQLREEPPRLGPIFRIGLVDANHYLLEVFDASQFADDMTQRRGSNLTAVTGQDERDRRVLRKGAQLPLQPAYVRTSQPVQRRDRACLEEIGHDHTMLAVRVPTQGEITAPPRFKTIDARTASPNTPLPV